MELIGLRGVEGLVYFASLNQVAQAAADTTAKSCLFCVGVGNLQWIHDNSIVVDFTENVRLHQIVPRYFVIFRDVVAFTKTRNAQVDILYSCVTVNENDVVIKYVAVEDQNTELDQYRDEKANFT